MNIITKEIDLGDGRKITIETGKVAKQADGSVILRQGNTVLLALYHRKLRLYELY